MSEFDKGIAFLSVVPMRGEPSDASEQVNVVLFGESFSILEEQPKWIRIQLDHDGYEGWIDRLQYQPISASYYELLATTPLRVSLDPVQLLQGTGPTDYIQRMHFSNVSNIYSSGIKSGIISMRSIMYRGC